jgi:hypothetical protein
MAKMKYILALALLIGCYSPKQSNMHLVQTPTDTVPTFKITPEMLSRLSEPTKYIIVINDGEGNRAMRDSCCWTIKGDCGKILEMLLRDNKSMQKEIDSLNGKLNYFMHL